MRMPSLCETQAYGSPEEAAVEKTTQEAQAELPGQQSTAGSGGHGHRFTLPRPPLPSTGPQMIMPPPSSQDTVKDKQV